MPSFIGTLLDYPKKHPIMNGKTDLRTGLRASCAVMCLLASCTAEGPASFSLTGTVDEYSEAEAVYLSYPIQQGGQWYERTDTARIVNGRFRFDGRISGTTPAYIHFDNMDDVTFYIEPTQVRIGIIRSRPYDCRLSGVSVAGEVAEYRKALGAVADTLGSRRTRALRADDRWSEAYDRGATQEALDSLWMAFLSQLAEYKALLPCEDSIRVAFAAAHPDYAIVPDLIYQSARSGFSSVDRLRELYGLLPEASHKSIAGQIAGTQLDLLVHAACHEVGCQAPDFQRTDAAGRSVRLEEMKGHHVLLDFWASWCGPCLKAAPSVRKAWELYADRGLRIVGISSDDDIEEWRTAIESHGLSAWPQVLSIESGAGNMRPLFPELSNIGTRYDVQYIPYFVLIDPQGRIAARWQQLGDEEFALLDSLLH